MLPGSDEALFQRLLRGELAAFDELYARHERHLFAFLRGQTSGPAEAEEVLQETFLALLREGKAGREARSFRGWLYQVARHLCLNRARSRRRAEKAFLEVAQAPAAETVHPERALEARQLSEAVRVAVTRLPPAMGELYRLRASGLSYEELADVLGLPLGTVKSRMHELLGRLREEVRS